MATKRKPQTCQVFESVLVPGQIKIQHNEHIVGVLRSTNNGVLVQRIKTDEGVWIAPGGELTKPFDSQGAAVNAVFSDWLARTESPAQLQLISA